VPKLELLKGQTQPMGIARERWIEAVMLFWQR